MDALTLNRLHFAFTITYHYLFPQLTMGLALLIVVLKTLALRTGDEHYDLSARFWAPVAQGALGVGVPGLFGIVALGLLHHCRERVDAAPGGLSSAAEWGV
jgi:cytochrome bd-type quinol oxidase subunit 1